MTTLYTIYNTTTGIIHSAYQSPDAVAPTVPDGHSLLTGGYYSMVDYYIDVAASNTPTAKPDLQTIILQDVTTIDADGLDRCIFSNIPVGITVEIQPADGYTVTTAVITDEIVEVTYNKPGLYFISFVDDYYKPATFSVEAV